MDNMELFLQEMPITRLMIPGSHHSGSVKTFSGYFADDILNRYSVSQEESVWNQMVFGIRMLDIHVRIELDRAERFYIIHETLKYQPLKYLLK